MSRYRIRRPIHVSEMAEVLEAVIVGEREFERRVVIKRLLPEASRDESFVRAFIDEARIAGQLHHSRIVSVLDFGTMDGRPFLVLEFVDGLNLFELAKLAEEFPIDVALHIVGEIGQALAYAHGAKDASGRSLSIVHRDVSPANILVSWEDGVKLTDFGIALATDRLERTRVGTAKGTLSYMSPEQLAVRTVDPRSDLFSLGCVLHRLVAGYSPLEDGAVRNDVASGAAFPIDPKVPTSVSRIIERATRFAKERRYQNALELTDDCDEALREFTQRPVRTLMREWLELVHPTNVPVVKPSSYHELFDLELIDEGTNRDPIRRFETVVRPEATRATELAHLTQVTALDPPTIVDPPLEATPLLPTPLLPTPPMTTAPMIAPTVLRPRQRSIAPLWTLAVASLALASAAYYFASQRHPALVIIQEKKAEPTAIPVPRAEGIQTEPVIDPIKRRPAPVTKPVAPAPEAEVEAPTPAIDPPMIQARLQRIAAMIPSLAGKVTQERQQQLEARYFDVRVKLKPSLSDAECRALDSEVLEVEREIKAAIR